MRLSPNRAYTNRSYQPPQRVLVKRFLLAALTHTSTGLMLERGSRVFDSEQEALDWAEDDDDFKRTAFTIIPHYEYRTVED